MKICKAKDCQNTKGNENEFCRECNKRQSKQIIKPKKQRKAEPYKIPLVEKANGKLYKLYHHEMYRPIEVYVPKQITLKRDNIGNII